MESQVVSLLKYEILKIILQEFLIIYCNHIIYFDLFLLKEYFYIFLRFNVQSFILSNYLFIYHANTLKKVFFLFNQQFPLFIIMNFYFYIYQLINFNFMNYILLQEAQFSNLINLMVILQFLIAESQLKFQAK